MVYTMPQEIEVWYILPTLRKELAKCLVKHFGLSQRKAAELLGITEAAVSQYISSKRGVNMDLCSECLDEIKKSAEIIMKDSSRLMHELNRLCKTEHIRKKTCALHREKVKCISSDCRICMEEK